MCIRDRAAAVARPRADADVGVPAGHPLGHRGQDRLVVLPVGVDHAQGPPLRQLHAGEDGRRQPLVVEAAKHPHPLVILGVGLGQLPGLVGAVVVDDDDLVGDPLSLIHI